MQEESYYNFNGISSTSLKDFEWQAPFAWKEIYIDKIKDKEIKRSFTNGSYLDCLMLNPNSLDELFYVGNYTKPISDTLERIVTNCYYKLKIKYPDLYHVIDFSNLEDNDSNEIVLECAKNENYGKGSYQNERIIKEIKNGGNEYYHFLCNANERVIISLSDQMQAIEKKESLLSHESTRPYFYQDEREILLHHLQIFIHDKPSLKGELDIVRIVPDERIIYITDLKTSHSSFGFLENVRKFSYATQLGFYKFLLTEYIINTMKKQPQREITTNHNNIKLPFDILQYTIICQNIVIDDKQKIPYIYHYTDLDLDYYRFGSDFILDSNIRYKRGWENTLNTIKWHIENNLWDYPMSHYLNGFLTLNLIKGYVE